MKSIRGYTLVELLVAMSIMVVFAAVVLPGFKRQTPEQALEQAALDVRSSVLAARTLALAPQTRYAGTYYYRAEVDSSTNKVNLYQLDSTKASVTIMSGRSKTLPSIVTVGSSWKVDFQVAQNNISFIPSVTKEVKLSVNNNQRKATVSVDPVTGHTDITIEQTP